MSKETTNHRCVPASWWSWDQTIPDWLNHSVQYFRGGIRAYAYSTNYKRALWQFDWEPVINHIESLNLVRMHLGEDTYHGKRKNPWSNAHVKNLCC